jgi:hypothetical protein
MFRPPVALLISLALCSGCGKVASSKAPAPDMAMFATLIYPLLLRDCAFNNVCHGSPDRFFQILGPGRTRISTMLDATETASPAEIQFSYDRTRAMLMTSESVTRSLLLTKPLELKAGGVAHKGADHFGRNVYRTAQDPSYVLLLQWAGTTQAGPSVGPGVGTGGKGTGGMGTGGTGMGTGGAGMGTGRGTGGGGAH